MSGEPKVTAGPVVAALTGVRPWGATAPQTVDVREGDVFHLGRLDQGWLRRSGIYERHLALGPGTRTTVSAVSLTVVGLHDTIEVRTGPRLVDATVDGLPLNHDAIRLQGPRHEIVVDPTGVPQAVLVRLRRHAGATVAIPAVYSGDTLLPVLSLTAPRVRRMAAALAWPLVADAAPPLTVGWSTAAISMRYLELWGIAPADGRRVLHDLRTALVNARSSDGRTMLSIPEVAPWPWPSRLELSGYVSQQAFTEGKNHLLAVHVAASTQIGHVVAAALERIR
jgi:hypothetical protein